MSLHGGPPPVHAYKEGSLGFESAAAGYGATVSTVAKYAPLGEGYEQAAAGIAGMGEYFAESGIDGLGVPPPVHAYREGSLGAMKMGPATYAVLGTIGLSVGAWLGWKKTKRASIAALGGVIGLALGATIPRAIAEQTGA